ncbi:SOS response-associated peptidase, partial [Salmonella enterica subsp. enterica serovar Weltevreden]|nr:SOS response-associated peptidase [Salmonella enterica subsp. enterica serovar Weltevreden]EEJ8496220.1 SOS response-associated peptidase [Salmonella enterica subsp. enterica]
LTPETARVWMRQFLEPHSKSITYRVIPALTRPMMRKDTNPCQ